MQLTTGSLGGNRQIKAAVLALIIVATIWELASWIVAGSDKMLIMFGLSLVVLALVVHILNDWSSGVLLFFSALRETVYFPIAFAIWWYAVEGLVLLMYFGMQSYQDYVNNAYLWLFVGVLFRLPTLAEMPQPVPIPKHLRSGPRWRLALIGK